MEYKGMTIRQSANGNVIVTGRNGEFHIITNRGYLSDEKIRELVDKKVRFSDSSEE